MIDRSITSISVIERGNRNVVSNGFFKSVTCKDESEVCNSVAEFIIVGNKSFVCNSVSEHIECKNNCSISNCCGQSIKAGQNCSIKNITANTIEIGTGCAIHNAACDKVIVHCNDNTDAFLTLENVTVETIEFVGKKGIIKIIGKHEMNNNKNITKIREIKNASIEKSN